MGLGGVFSVEWIHKESLPFHCTQHILNPWNESKRVQISRDGQVNPLITSLHPAGVSGQTGVSYKRFTATKSTLILFDGLHCQFISVIFISQLTKSEFVPF